MVRKTTLNADSSWPNLLGDCAMYELRNYLLIRATIQVVLDMKVPDWDPLLVKRNVRIMKRICFIHTGLNVTSRDMKSSKSTNTLTLRQRTWETQVHYSSSASVSYVNSSGTGASSAPSSSSSTAVRTPAAAAAPLAEA